MLPRLRGKDGSKLMVQVSQHCMGHIQRLRACTQIERNTVTSLSPVWIFPITWPRGHPRKTLSRVNYFFPWHLNMSVKVTSNNSVFCIYDWEKTLSLTWDLQSSSSVFEINYYRFTMLLICVLLTNFFSHS